MFQPIRKISQIASFPQVIGGENLKNIWNHKPRDLRKRFLGFWNDKVHSHQ